MNATLGKKKLIRDISANTLQTVITQLFGLIIFYITSKYLQKNDFGELNWCLAVGSTAIAISSLGLDLIFVKRVALGDNILVICGIHFFHTLVTGAVLSAIAFGVGHFVPTFDMRHPLFALVFLNLAIANVANSFKLCLNGLEAFRRLALLSLCVNTFKLCTVLFLYISGQFSIWHVVMAYLATSALELLLGYAMMSRRLATRVKPLLKVVEYRYFILESLPQLGVVLFDSPLARIDWILLGIISTAAATAEYSFVYKIFELSRMPLLIIAPVLLTRFSKVFNATDTISEQRKQDIHFFFKLELFIVMIIPILLICSWSPLIDYFTNNKYGSVNEQNYWILAVCVPLHGIINFLWTMGFVQGQLKPILFITIGASLLNIAANAALIPTYGTSGAAMAFFISTLVQLLLYLKFIDQRQIKLKAGPILTSFASAVLSIVIAKYLINNIIFAAVAAVMLHTAITLITKQIQPSEIKNVLLKRPVR